MAGRALKTKLYGVGSADAGALAFAPALLLVTVLLTGLVPARRLFVPSIMLIPMIRGGSWHANPLKMQRKS
jgi:hypothetical protein